MAIPISLIFLAVAALPFSISLHHSQEVTTTSTNSTPNDPFQSKGMDGIKHRIVRVNGINMHMVEKGHGPTVLLLHGFPQLWYTWRHQIPALAAHGYRAVAPDLRGYGKSDAPAGAANYSAPRVVGDLIALMDAVAPTERKVFVVGHDWGAIIAWYLCLYRPDRVKALVNLSVAFRRRDPNQKPVEALRAVYGDDAYIVRFQEPGKIEREFAEIGTERVLLKFLTYRHPTLIILPDGFVEEWKKGTIERPFWLSQKDLDYYVSHFDKTGFTGALNYYRAIDLTWELNSPWTGAQVKVPAKFIIGDLDLTYNTVKEYIRSGGFKQDVPFLEELVVMKGVAHFINEEKPHEINKHILNFFCKF